MTDHAARGLTGIVPPFKGGDGDGRGEFAQTIELDASPLLPERARSLDLPAAYAA
jgi:hypothetical protein